MKNILLATAFIIGGAISVHAQVPDGYYNTAIGKTGVNLRIALYNKIKGHSSLGYGGLWTAYHSTDKQPSNGKVWDIYSDNPGGTTPYYFDFGSDQCSGESASSENDCYNREHTWPQSKFGANEPMKSDLWIVYPTDGYVNMKRANYPYGRVSSATWTSLNGSRLGVNTYPGAPSVLSFEPHDSFKGDIARSYFYISTRYYSEDGGWENWEMANGADLHSWTKAMLLEWHHSDPVSQKEIDRNNAVYLKQGNRNPYIDHPEMADCVFGTEDCTGLLSIGDNDFSRLFEVYPNPSGDILNIQLKKTVPALQEFVFEIYDMTGRRWVADASGSGTGYAIHTGHLGSGNYLLRIWSGTAAGSIKFVKK